MTHREQTLFSLSDDEITVSRPKADLQILSGVRSGGRNYDECMADWGFWQCSGEAASCYCVDNGTGDWD